MTSTLHVAGRAPATHRHRRAARTRERRRPVLPAGRQRRDAAVEGRDVPAGQLGRLRRPRPVRLPPGRDADLRRVRHRQVDAARRLHRAHDAQRHPVQRRDQRRRRRPRPQPRRSATCSATCAARSTPSPTPTPAARSTSSCAARARHLGCGRHDVRRRPRPPLHRVPRVPRPRPRDPRRRDHHADGHVRRDRSTSPTCTRSPCTSFAPQALKAALPRRADPRHVLELRHTSCTPGSASAPTATAPRRCACSCASSPDSRSGPSTSCTRRWSSRTRRRSPPPTGRSTTSTTSKRPTSRCRPRSARPTCSPRSSSTHQTMIDAERRDQRRSTRSASPPAATPPSACGRCAPRSGCSTPPRTTNRLRAHQRRRPAQGRPGPRQRQGDRARDHPAAAPRQRRRRARAARHRHRDADPAARRAPAAASDPAEQHRRAQRPARDPRRVRRRPAQRRGVPRLVRRAEPQAPRPARRRRARTGAAAHRADRPHAPSAPASPAATAASTSTSTTCALRPQPQPGMSAAELPFVAELLDVAPEHSQWRTAIETVLGASARTMLVPLDRFGEFSRAIDPLHLRGRPQLPGRPAPAGRPVPRRPRHHRRQAPVQGLARSPAWVQSHVSDPARNALCVETAGRARRPRVPRHPRRPDPPRHPRQPRPRRPAPTSSASAAPKPSPRSTSAWREIDTASSTRQDGRARRARRAAAAPRATPQRLRRGDQQYAWDDIDDDSVERSIAELEPRRDRDPALRRQAPRPRRAHRRISRPSSRPPAATKYELAAHAPRSSRPSRAGSSNAQDKVTDELDPHRAGRPHHPRRHAASPARRRVRARRRPRRPRQPRRVRQQPQAAAAPG